LGFAGVVGMAISGARWRAGKRKLRKLQPHPDKPRRLQWGLGDSSPVF
jgi:hypothetical protein